MKTLSLVTMKAIICLIGFWSCTTGEHFKTEEKKHWVEIKKPGLGMIYIDSVNNKAILKQSSDTGNTRFLTYLVGFQDSLMQTDQAKELEKGKYFQYEMDKNWTAIVNGDSVKPVFFQPKTKRNKGLDEAILVFEIPKDQTIEALVYEDNFDSWGIQTISLKKN